VSNIKNKIPLIGLLGGIGSGKSTVARIFEKLGCARIDADTLAHEVLETSEVKKTIVRRWGEGILLQDGRVNRKAVADIVFRDAEELSFLNGLILPRAFELVRKAVFEARNQGKVKAIVLDAPLLAEVGWDRECDILVFVDCDNSKRTTRLLARAGLDEKQLAAREKFQISLDKKARMAYYVINNNADFSALESQVGCVFSKITGVE